LDFTGFSAYTTEGDGGTSTTEEVLAEATLVGTTKS